MAQMESFWLDNSRESVADYQTRLQATYEPLKSNIRVDVAVIGGGITGVTAAYLLKQAGFTVALIERERIGYRDTGHTTAHLSFVTDMRLDELARNFGRDHAQAAWDAGRAAMDQIHHLVHQESIDCGFKWVPGYLHTPWESSLQHEVRRLQEEAQLATELGFPATFIETVPVVNRPGVRFVQQAKFHPLNYIRSLLTKIPGQGSYVCEQTEAKEIVADPRSVRTIGGEIYCKQLLIATHVPLMGLSGVLGASLFQTKLMPYSTYAIGATISKGTLPEALFWDTTDPYYYLRVDHLSDVDYLIFGGRDHKTGQASEAAHRFSELEQTLTAQIEDARITHRWTGQVIETNDGLPFIGPTDEGQFIATSFSGNGMTFGTLAAMMATDHFAGRRNPWQELFDPSRKKLKGSTWDYLRENIDYPYYYLKDRLTQAEAGSVDEVPPGSGKILKIDGQRIAVYRGQDGKVCRMSSICPHMGCVVHWNDAASTWDCPCHGSRFKATGEVIAGPAEESLETIDD